MPFIKCSRCRCMRQEEDYEIYKGIRRKSCLKYKITNKKQKEKTNTTKDNDLTHYIRHQKLFKKINNQVLERVSKSVHVYNMKYIFVDIHDCLIHSDEDFSYTNY